MKGLSATQVEQLQQIGDYLRQVREIQAVPLEKVAKDTFIPLRLLNALEAGDADRLPEPVYIKGFIRRYADVLDLDGAEIADAFEAFEPVANPIPEQPAAQSETVTTPPSLAESTPAAESAPRVKFPGLPYLIVGVAVLGGLGAIAWGLKQALQPGTSSVASSPPSSSTPSTLLAPQANSAAPPAAQSPGSGSTNSLPQNARPGEAPDSAASTAPTEAPVQVEISLVDESWMEVVADGEVAFEGTLAQGEQRTWTAQNTLQIRAGNAGAVVASHNEGQAKPLGAMGDVVDANFSRKAAPSPIDRAPQ